MAWSYFVYKNANIFSEFHNLQIYETRTSKEEDKHGKSKGTNGRNFLAQKEEYN